MAMFGSFRRHQKWIWLLGVIVIIPSFVIFFSPDVDFNKTSRGGGMYDFGSLEGHPISRDEYLPFYNEARLSYFVRSGRWPSSEEATQNRLETDALSRLLLVRKIREFDIHVSNVAVARLAQRQLRDYPLAEFVNQVLRPQGFNEKDYQNFLRNEAGIQQLASITALGGKLVNPREAEMLFRKEYENIHAEVAGFWTSNYLDKITVTPEALRSFYTNRMQLYREPDRIQVSYVAFPASNYLTQADEKLTSVTNFNELIDQSYRQRGAEFFKDTNGVVLSAEDAKAKIREEARLDYALREAEIQANQFGHALLDRPQPNTAEDLNAVADALGLPVQVTPPFSRNEDLEALGLPPVFGQQANLLSPENPLRVEPIVTKDAAYMIAFKNEIKGQIPSFEDIQEKVTGDYRQQKARELANVAGQSFLSKLTNGLAMNKSFTELCQVSGVIPLTLPAFSPGSRFAPEGWDSRVDIRAVQQQSENLEVGEVSRYNRSPDGGYIVYIRERTPVEESKLQQELPEFTRNLRQYRISQAFDEWFRKTVEQAKLAAPRRTPELGPESSPPPAPTPNPGSAPTTPAPGS